MKSILLLILLMLPLTKAQEALVGDWQGEIGPGILNLGVIVHFKLDNKLTGRIDIPAQQSMDVPLEILEVTESNIRFAIQGVPGQPTFEGRLEQDTLSGTFTQSGQSLPFNLERMGTSSAQGPAVIESYLGNWEGRIQTIDLKVGLSFIDNKGIMESRITIPAQGFKGLIKIEEISEQSITLLIQGIPGNPTFIGELSGDTLAGTFTQSGQDLPFSLKRTNETLSLKRPQDPLEPFPYLVEEVSFSNGDINIAGTLTLPDGQGPFSTVVLITGSGPQNRDEELLGHRPFLVISDALTRAGFAVLRTDDRGVGGSSGDLSQASYEDLASDVMAGLEFLKTRSDIDAKRIGLFGHSEGGYIAPFVASQSQDVAFVIMMAGPSVNGLEVLKLQNQLILKQEGASEEEIEKQLIYLEEFADALERNAYDKVAKLTEGRMKDSFANLPEDEKPSPEVQTQMIEAQITEVATPYFRNIVVFDPQFYLKKLTIPVLAFYGSKDIQVDAEQSVEPLRQALQEAGNDDVTIKVFEGLNHLMQPSKTGALNEYAEIEITVAPEVLETVIQWLQARF
jgi:pimeloyl-ACP methyl ester carboxylesterase